eukprot:4958915-Pyramimonas_sp.AAC.1
MSQQSSERPWLTRSASRAPRRRAATAQPTHGDAAKSTAGDQQESHDDLIPLLPATPEIAT